jgi:hypothetical protein
VFWGFVTLVTPAESAPLKLVKFDLEYLGQSLLGVVHLLLSFLKYMSCGAHSLLVSLTQNCTNSLRRVCVDIILRTERQAFSKRGSGDDFAADLNIC